MMTVDDRTKYLADQSLKLLEDIGSAQIREAQNRQKLYTQTTVGALALSVSFLTLSGIDTVIFVRVLEWSWCLLIGALVCQLSSYVFVDMHFRKYEQVIREWRKDGMNTSKLPNETNNWTAVTRVLNYIGYALTVSGLVVMVIFAILNITK